MSVLKNLTTCEASEKLNDVKDLIGNALVEIVVGCGSEQRTIGFLEDISIRENQEGLMLVLKANSSIA